MKTLADMAALPWPTDAQVDAFVEHVCWAHSWYKHLPFDESARFVVFLATDAAAGYETRERLHHGWKTTAQYREQYGLIDYAWLFPDDDEGWRRDGAGASVEPSPELLAIAGFNLGPTCSNDDNAIDVICMLWPDEANFDSAAAQAPFEKLTELHRRWEEAYQTRAGDVPEHERRLHDHYESMRAPQVARIRDAIARLRDAVSR